jgi:hypothetical protein
LYSRTNLFIRNENKYAKEIQPLIKQKINIFGVELEANMNDVLEMKYGRYVYLNIKKDFVEKYKDKYEEQLNIEEIKKGVEEKKKEVDERNKKIQKLYDELYEVYSSLGYKSDIKKLEEINELLYCEAETFLNKIENKIFEKKTAKAIRCFKKLMEIRNKSDEIIECY